MFGALKLLITLGIAGALAFFVIGDDLAGAGIEGHRVRGISDVDATGFTVDMDVTVNNPSKLSVNIDRIDYVARLRDTNEAVSTGHITDLSIPKQQVTTVSLNPRINWTPGANTILRYASQDKVWMDVELTVKVFDFIPAAKVTVPVDIKEAFDFAERNPDSKTILNGTEENHGRGNFLTRLF